METKEAVKLKTKTKKAKAESTEPKTESKAEAPAKPKTPASNAWAPRVTFTSREKEPSQFSIIDNYASRAPDGRLVWEFSEEEAERVRRHHFVVTGRVVEV